MEVVEGPPDLGSFAILQEAKAQEQISGLANRKNLRALRHLSASNRFGRPLMPWGGNSVNLYFGRVWAFKLLRAISTS